jgi:hypothetical protein
MARFRRDVVRAAGCIGTAMLAGCGIPGGGEDEEGGEDGGNGGGGGGGDGEEDDD